MIAFFCWIGLSASASVLSARRRTSLLNVSSSCALWSTVVASVGRGLVALRRSPRVLASTAANAVPSVAENADSTDGTCSLLLVKSVRTCRARVRWRRPPPRSAGVICSSTHLIAESTAFCTSSGCIELVSKSSVSKRWPATSSDVSGFEASRRDRLGARARRCAVRAVGAAVAAALPRASRHSRSARRWR